MKSGRPISILYVDDEPGLLDVCRLYLERDDRFIVHITDDPQEAKRLMDENRIDVIVSDYQMPSMDGIEFLRDLRATGNDTPFIIFTGRGREEIVIEAFNSGADFYVHKGGDVKSQFSELINKIVYAHHRRSAEDTVRKQIEAMESSIDGMALFDPAQNHIYANKAYASMYGFDDPQDLIGKPWRVLYSEEDLRRYEDEVVPIAMSQGYYRGRLYSRRKDGSIFNHELYLLMLNDLHFTVVIRDLTDLMELESDVLQMKNNLQTLFNGIQEMLFITDDGLNILQVNHNAMEKLGLNEKDLMGMNILDLHIPERRMELDAVLRTVSGDNPIFHKVPLMGRNGSIILAETSVTLGLWNGEKAYTFMSRELSDIRSLEGALRENGLFCFSSDDDLNYVVIYDEQGDILYVNNNVAEALGCTKEELIGRSISSFITEPDKNLVMEKSYQRSEGHSVEPYEATIRKMDGSVYRVRLQGERISYGDKHHMLVVFNQI